MSNEELLACKRVIQFLRKQIGDDFYKAWLRCGIDPGSLAVRVRFQPSKAVPTFRSGGIKKDDWAELGVLLRDLKTLHDSGNSELWNAITFTVDDRDEFTADFSFDDIEKLGLGAVFAAWDKKYLSGLQPIPEKMPPR
ncbi:MAG: DUF600 family protein [Verrucomicrobia bacterium]|nr:DUF600 family protein [Verrucomicrobiota bacterium]